MAFRWTMALLALLLVPPPVAGSGGDPCDWFESTDYVVGVLRVHYGSHRCHWYDIWQKAEVTEHVERYDGYAPDPAAGLAERLAFIHYTVYTEMRFLDGRTTLTHRTYLSVGGAYLQHDYLENRARDGTQSCRGAAEAKFGPVPGQLLIPTTPQYPRCVPPGLLS